jgi:ABC-type transport system substrate-binding protein
LRLYETDEIDMTGIGAYNAERFLDPEEPLHSQLISGVGLCTGFVYFDTTRPPFEDVIVRKAFSMAFDKQKFIDVLLRGQALPANGPYPPGLPGFRYDHVGLPYDPGKRELLDQSKYGGAPVFRRSFIRMQARAVPSTRKQPRWHEM